MIFEIEVGDEDIINHSVPRGIDMGDKAKHTVL